MQNFFFTADFPKVLKEHGTARIVNGFDTTEPLPYQLQLVALIEVQKFGVSNQFCGAILITPEYAVSGQGWC